MNKIELKNSLIVLKEIDKSIKVTEIEASVPSYKISFSSSTELEVLFDSNEECKLSIEYELDSNIKANIYEIRTGEKTKVQYTYTLKDDAKLYLYRLNMSLHMREVDIVNLDGINSHIEFNLRSLSQDEEKYDIFVSHNNKNTFSIVNNIGIALKGSIIFNVTGDVPKGSSGSYLDQNNQIVTFDSTKSQIDPNLLIDEYEVEANHNAVIGTFDDETLFYLMSRGISYDDAIKLLCEGLILNNLKENYDKEKILNLFSKYWR